VEKLFTIELTRSEKELLLNDLDLETVVGDKMRILAQRGNTITVKLERKQVERMVDALEEAAADAGESRAGKGVPRSLREAGARRTTGLRLGRPAPPFPCTERGSREAALHEEAPHRARSFS